MEYRIKHLAELSGVSTRTLRYYDEIGLLSPSRKHGNGYRIYESEEVNLLQQILFYRELGVSLDDIKKIVWSKEYNREAALNDHLQQLMEKRENINRLIANVEKTIAASKGEIEMSDKEKFQGFKKKMIDENEKKYGEEIREKFGEEEVAKSNAKLMGMTREQYERTEALSNEINEGMKKAVMEDDPTSELAQKVCALHEEWLKNFWSSYSKQAHWGLAQMYVEDPRFKQYYDDIQNGAAEFLRDALKTYCEM